MIVQLTVVWLPHLTQACQCKDVSLQMLTRVGADLEVSEGEAKFGSVSLRGPQLPKILCNMYNL